MMAMKMMMNGDEDDEDMVQVIYWLGHDPCLTRAASRNAREAHI